MADAWVVVPAVLIRIVMHPILLAVQQQLGVLEEANRHQRDELIRTHAELQELQGKYKSLQTAHALTADSPERSQARKQLSAIISKVDKTLELLKE